ncbi:hypothetical protein OG842_02470 [Streptomyces sp. NBC_00376]|uniref:hypothetical protein n=1 Tax=unclassified Streptomyces TaxID=2593676 RepID=UPI002E1E6072
MLTPTPDDRAAAAWLCAALPELQDAAADDDHALDRLDRAVAAVRDGRPAAEVSRLLGYEPAPDPDKSAGRPADGHPESLDVFGLDAVTVRGTYRCPGGRCGRRAGADENGREPRCVIDEAPMVFRSL